MERARRKLPRGESLRDCEECGSDIPDARRQAVPGVRLCVACQEAQDREEANFSLINRRGVTPFVLSSNFLGRRSAKSRTVRSRSSFDWTLATPLLAELPTLARFAIGQTSPM